MYMTCICMIFCISPSYQFFFERASKFDLVVSNATYASSLVLSIFNCFFWLRLPPTYVRGWPVDGARSEGLGGKDSKGSVVACSWASGI